MLKHTFLLSIAVILFVQCSTEPEIVLVQNHGPAQGSTYNISYLVSPGIDYRRQIDSILFEIDKSMSLWDEQSTISKLNRGEVVVPDPLFIEVFKKSKQISRETLGAFDISVAPLVSYWGFGPQEHGKLDSARVDSIRAFVGFRKLVNVLDSNKLPKGMKVDMNAIAQGFTVDVIAQFLFSKGVTNFMVEVGGELRTSGRTIDKRIWTIGVDKPQENLDTENRFQVILALDSLALATSGNYRKFWVDEETGMKYVHTINPKTGYPVKTRLLSSTIITDNAMEADAWATVCMVVGLEEAIKLINENRNLEAYFVYSDLEGNWQIWQSEGFAKMVL